MILGLFFPLGDSLSELEKNGKLTRLTDYYLPAYLKKFKCIYIFSYGLDHDFVLPKGCVLLPNKHNFHRVVYTLLLPVIYWGYFCRINTSRVLQLSGIVPALIAKMVWGVKVFVTFGYDYRSVEKLTGHYFKSSLYILIEKLLLPISDKVIFSSKTIQRAVNLSLSKSVFIPNGVDVTKFKPLPKSKKSKFMILVQSRLSPEKNMEALIRAVSDSALNVKLLIIGSGSLKNNLEGLAKTLKVNLSIKGKVHNDEMPKYFNKSDIYVHPSITEGSPKALIEAACCGCCILATDILQNREILGDDAMYFKIGQHDLAEKLKYLYNNPSLRTKNGISIRKTVRNKFDIKKLLLRETRLLSGNTPD